jgi:hypothetical protein
MTQNPLNSNAAAELTESTARDVESNETAESVAESNFDPNIIKSYPKSNKRIGLNISKFGISASDKEEKEPNGQSMHISPHGIEFKTTEDFVEGSLLKIHINIPDYWKRKQQFVEYTRIDAPTDFRVLAKVVRTEDISKRGKKKVITVQTLVIDDVDERVLKTFLQEN